MKKLIVSLACVAILMGWLLVPRSGVSQEPAKSQNPANPDSVPHKIGLIDMAHVFNEYAKFKSLREDLREQVTLVDGEAKAMVEELEKLKAHLTSGQLSEESEEFSELKKTFIGKQTDLESFRKAKQREFLKKEADIYKTVYLEVQDHVKLYADAYKYTLIMRFNRDSVENAENPQEIMHSMNRPVVYHRVYDDLTDPILNYLNEQYSRATAQPARGAPRPTSTATRPTGNGQRTK